jgi:hypothetical protein
VPCFPILNKAAGGGKNQAREMGQQVRAKINSEGGGLKEGGKADGSRKEGGNYGERFMVVGQ